LENRILALTQKKALILSNLAAFPLEFGEVIKDLRVKR